VWVTMTFPVRDGDVVAGDGGIDCNRTLTQPGVCNQGVVRRTLAAQQTAATTRLLSALLSKSKKIDKQTSTKP